MQTLFPAIKPYDVQEFPVGDGHTLYLEQSGNPDGIPVLVIHGGPGAGTSDRNRRFFDPNEYRIILYDQRGAGRSIPHASLDNNATEDLLQDIEKIREHLGINRWVLFAGSWGATLALLYAQNHPTRVESMILRGIWLLRQEDIDWVYGPCGASKLFPEYYRKFCNHLPEELRDNLIGNYYKLLTGEDEIARLSAAKAWGEWEGRCCSLEPNPDIIERLTEPHTALAFARICSHYIVNKGFIPENNILDHMHLIEKIPGYIIHGRYDAICPAENAWLLHQSWPNSELIFVRDAGHSADEPALIDALVQATQRLIK